MATSKPGYEFQTPNEHRLIPKSLAEHGFGVGREEIRKRRLSSKHQVLRVFRGSAYSAQLLLNIASQITERLLRKNYEISQVLNLVVQFGGGKTDSLALLYHLTTNGSMCIRGGGLYDTKSRDKALPDEMIWTLCAKVGFANVPDHDQEFIPPRCEVFHAFMPKNKLWGIAGEASVFISNCPHNVYRLYRHDALQFVYGRSHGSDKVSTGGVPPTSRPCQDVFGGNVKDLSRGTRRCAQ